MAINGKVRRITIIKIIFLISTFESDNFTY